MGFKDDISKFKMPLMNGSKETVDYIMTRSLEEMLDTLDAGKSVSVETCRQSGRTATALCYAAKMLEYNKDSFIILYNNTLEDCKLSKFKIRKIADANNLDLSGDDFESRIIMNPPKKYLKKILSKVCMILYDDLGFHYSKINHQIDLSTGRKILSIISSADQTTLENRRGYDEFTHIKYNFWEDCKDLHWYREICKAMGMDWFCIRNEILLDHSRSSEPVPADELNIFEEH